MFRPSGHIPNLIPGELFPRRFIRRCQITMKHQQKPNHRSEICINHKANEHHPIALNPLPSTAFTHKSIKKQCQTPVKNRIFRGQIPPKLEPVSLPNAVPRPGTVVIVHCHTYIADPAVPGPQRLLYIAHRAVPGFYLYDAFLLRGGDFHTDSALRLVFLVAVVDCCVFAQGTYTDRA